MNKNTQKMKKLNVVKVSFDVEIDKITARER